jgi:hypothetical protein
LQSADCIRFKNLLLFGFGRLRTRKKILKPSFKGNMSSVVSDAIWPMRKRYGLSSDIICSLHAQWLAWNKSIVGLVFANDEKIKLNKIGCGANLYLLITVWD